MDKQVAPPHSQENEISVLGRILDAPELNHNGATPPRQETDNGTPHQKIFAEMQRVQEAGMLVKMHRRQLMGIQDER